MQKSERTFGHLPSWGNFMAYIKPQHLETTLFASSQAPAGSGPSAFDSYRKMIQQFLFHSPSTHSPGCVWGSWGGAQVWGSEVELWSRCLLEGGWALCWLPLGGSCVLTVGYTWIFNRDRAFFGVFFFLNSERWISVGVIFLSARQKIKDNYNCKP